MSAAAARWPDGTLLSPLSGAVLRHDGDGLLRAEGELWPVIDHIPFLRADRVELARRAAVLLRDGDVTGATALLLTDQDPYAPDPPPSVQRCRVLVRDLARTGFRAAMAALEYGRVADYFAHRWSDPTFLSGLALLGRALPAPGGGVFELACGAGHYLAALAQAGVPAIGADLVFSKLWLARHFTSPDARLVCFDAGARWPLRDGAAATGFCHDAFYFLPDKSGIVSRFRSLVGDAGAIAIGHAHNAEAANHSAGQPLPVRQYAALLPGAALFDDLELTRAFIEREPARPGDVDSLRAVPALSMLWRGPATAPAAPERVPAFGTERSGRPLRLNPLYRRDDGPAAAIQWPSDRYRDEYAALASYPARWSGPDTLDPADPDAEALLRRRVYLDLPPAW